MDRFVVMEVSGAKTFIPVMLTPFRGDGSIDFPALIRLTEFYLEAGAGGLFTNCLSGEMYDLSESERMQVLEQVLEVADGSVPVLATGTFGGSLEAQAAFIRQVAGAGADAVILISSILAVEGEEEQVLTERTFRLMDLTEGVPLGFYECPVPYKRVLSACQLGAFVDTGRVTYLKDTCLDLKLVKAKLNAASGHPFGLYDAYMGHAVDSLKAGAAGLSCIQGNFFPELIVWLCRNYGHPGLKAEVERVQTFLIEGMELMHTAYPAIAKYFLCRRGILSNTFCRQPDGHFTPSLREKADRLFESSRELCRDLDVPF